MDKLEKLFSYGTLCYESVQLSIFGRKLDGAADILSGFKLSMVQITDIDIITKSGESVHPILTYTGNKDDFVSGLVFDISLSELHQADKYEVSDYKRTNVRLNSGNNAWVYIRS